VTYRIAELCAGYGGLGMGLELAGINIEHVWYSELHELTDKKGKTKPNPAESLMNEYYGIPNLGDLTEIHNPPKVDIVAAGFPCQPVSAAGLGKGHEDERWIIDDVCRVASESGAMLLVLENVRGLLAPGNRDAMARVCAALARFGFDAEWATLRASDVGACHERDRWFGVAYNADGLAGSTSGEFGPVDNRFVRSGNRTRAYAGHSQTPIRLLPTPTASNPNEGEDPDTFDARQKARVEAGSRPSPKPLGMVVKTLPTVEIEHPWGEYSDAIARHEEIMGSPPPSPAVDNKLSPLFVEWMQMIPKGRVTDHVEKRNDALFVLGNGVVPPQVAAAVGGLLDRVEGHDV